MFKVLVINPGSTSTKVALYEDEKEIVRSDITHDVETLKNYKSVIEQLDLRLEAINKWLSENGIKVLELSAIVVRGGLIKPVQSGTYVVNDIMLEDLRKGVGGEHPSNLGGIIGRALADPYGIPVYTLDPVAVDEMEDVARISGLPELPRKSQSHALNIKACIHRYARENNLKEEELNMIVAHMGGGISVAAIKGGRIVDVNNANQMGPFSPERTGSLPSMKVVEMCYSGKYTLEEMKKKIVGMGGLVAHLGTNDAREVVKRIEAGDKKAKLVFEAMAYQIAKEIGRMAAVLKGDVKTIILTGGLAYSKPLIEIIIDMVGFIAPITLYPGGDEMEALRDGALRVLRGQETPKIYG
ncbi:MAG: putative butyrate kinase 2 [Caldanaerobacter subterraneus]|uniref:Probable butyrate kinase 2 n=4 Tax=Caldanaerobacter subterraneus TaxID=911092 RepID=BUK2_CALS4|nr:butyrate kinase [Caldanaerobacter subterraneus]Q8R828.1 RecName: Full=Probable butyrate kinase 2; Short=BK 2; AltName: Full=Branched-chain carboxylic acid kinase 2 [Caldanaerobacter subterraneus subsp. tengcongensis MB4]AAM25360.1 Butyrate kinase [Caldanaerobacter subterraneus subsp. tengcongensis MB4]KUK08335.1 MAG: putative butyrate kinase 2 [Caldanaerobacter subterraneus]MBE3578823.1 butyrate kinase [Caldanaerobacter subterraneus]MCS3915035.1 butyrate kinase [Caldanaerobacter subterraneu